MAGAAQKFIAARASLVAASTPAHAISQAASEAPGLAHSLIRALIARRCIHRCSVGRHALSRPIDRSFFGYHPREPDHPTRTALAAPRGGASSV
jgi:hypothetical protein